MHCGHVVYSCESLNPVFSPSLNGLGDTPGVARGPLLKDLRRPDLLLLVINAGIHG